MIKNNVNVINNIFIIALIYMSEFQIIKQKMECILCHNNSILPYITCNDCSLLICQHCTITIEEVSFCLLCLPKNICLKRKRQIDEMIENKKPCLFMTFDNNIKCIWNNVIDSLLYDNEILTILILGRTCQDLYKLTKNDKKIWKTLYTQSGMTNSSTEKLFDFNLIGISTFKELYRFNIGCYLCKHSTMSFKKLIDMLPKYTEKGDKIGIQEARSKILSLIPYQIESKKKKETNHWNSIVHNWNNTTIPKYKTVTKNLYSKCHIQWIIQHIVNPTLVNFVQEMKQRKKPLSCKLFKEFEPTSCKLVIPDI